MLTSCVIAGGGPAGAMLALLLARAGVEVTLLEKHADFLRDFRGDTIHPSTLQVLDELGLADEFHRLPHRKVDRMAVFDGTSYVELTRFDRLPSRYPYVAFVPQWDFLDLITGHARRLSSFRLLMETEATGLIEEDGAVRGLRYRHGGREHEIRASLTVAADGRDSTVRRAAGLRPKKLGAPMDVVWFRLDRADDDPVEPFLRPSSGAALVALNRETYWQVAYLIPKGGYARLRASGIEGLRRSIGELVPFLADRTRKITSFEDTSVLSVKVDRLHRWHRPGLLCIGDAAHAMSPIGGVGINLAIQDAVATANLVGTPLARAQLSRRPVLDPAPASLLARVRRRRLPPTVLTQAMQVLLQRRVIAPMLAGDGAIERLPERVAGLPDGVRRLIGGGIGRMVGLGVLPEHVGPEFRGERLVR